MPNIFFNRFTRVSLARGQTLPFLVQTVDGHYNCCSTIQRYCDIAGIADGGVLFTEVIKIRKNNYRDKLRSPSVLPRTVFETSWRFHVCHVVACYD